MLVCSRNSEEANMQGATREEENMEEDEVRKVVRVTGEGGCSTF